MIVSIVSGTYNRLSHLQQMIHSVRQSVGVGIDYEIIIVDGGSMDGTIEWCKKQSDIRLIQHGKLLGAVQAFNDGASVAIGDYVIMANDDIIFIDESILSAIAFMQDSPDIGIGCFYQDRYNMDWHVDRMSAMLENGKRTSTYYGQVCIIPRWLGNEVGWWGDYLRTYGGDNEMSCNVLEFGYKVLPIPCACIHDTTPDDILRKANNDDVIKNGVHPDTAKWLKKWPYGPIISTTVKKDNPLQKNLRILYAPIYETGYPIQKIQKRGLRNALKKIGIVTEVDYVQQTFGKVVDVANAFKPHIILTQIQDASVVLSSDISIFKAHHPSTLLVNWNGDYNVGNLTDPKYILMMRQFHLCGFVTTKFAQLWKDNGINWMYWQIGFEESDATPTVNTPAHDIVFLGNGYSDARSRLARFLRSLKYDVGLYGSWPAWAKPNGNTLYDFDAGQKLYMNSTVAISDNQWDDAPGFVSNRLFQALASGVLVLQQHFPGCEELLGFKDGQHIIVWHDFDDLKLRIDAIMADVNAYATIAKQGKKFVVENHSFDARVHQLMDHIYNA